MRIPVAIFYFIGVYGQLVKGAIAPALVCEATKHANGSVTYHLSAPTPSTTCITQWMYPNDTVLTFNNNNSKVILDLTNQSITTNACLGNLKHSVDCIDPQWITDVECFSNCSTTPSSPAHFTLGPYPRNHIGSYAAVGLTFIAILILLVLCRRKYCSDVKDGVPNTWEQV